MSVVTSVQRGSHPYLSAEYRAFPALQTVANTCAVLIAPQRVVCDRDVSAFTICYCDIC